MSTQALTGLRDYLYGTLSTNDMMWLVEELQNYIRKEESPEPYTNEELNAMIDASEADIAAGKVYDNDDVMREWEEELSRAEQKEMELAKAV